MKPKFTTGEWKAEEHMFGGRSSQIIDGFYDADNNIILGANEYAVWLVKESDIRLIELAPLLAERIMEDYHKVKGRWHQVTCAADDEWCACGGYINGDDYLLDELAKLYEEGES